MVPEILLEFMVERPGRGGGSSQFRVTCAAMSPQVPSVLHNQRIYVHNGVMRRVASDDCSVQQFADPVARVLGASSTYPYETSLSCLSYSLGRGKKKSRHPAFNKQPRPTYQ